MDTQFKVGDVITGKQIATEQYSVTIRGAIMEVTQVYNDMVRVRVIGVDESMASASIEVANPYRDRREQVLLTTSQINLIQHDAERCMEFPVTSRYFEAYIQDEDYASKLNDFLDEM